MNQFISRYAQQISGTLAGFDRLVFRGQLAEVRHGNSDFDDFERLGRRK